MTAININDLMSTGLKIHTSASIELPSSIGRTMAALLSVIPEQGLEYGVYLQGHWDPVTATVKVVPDLYYVPSQEVSTGSISFTEEPPGPEWNVVMHRHPPGVRTFSTVDRDSINEEFLASILYIPMWEFPDAVINIPLAVGSKLQVKAVVRLDGFLIDIPNELREAAKGKIAKKVYPLAQQTSVYPGATVRPLGGSTITPLKSGGSANKAVDTGGKRTLPTLGAGGAKKTPLQAGAKDKQKKRGNSRGNSSVHPPTGTVQQVGDATITCLGASSER